jgi:molecular chaperone GrpE
LSDEQDTAGSGPVCDPEPGTTPQPEATGLAAVEPAPASPADELEALRQENAELRDQALRRRADFENYKRRVERDRALASQDALARALTALVPTLDNLERALGAEAPEGTLRDGLKLIHRDLLAVLEGLGLRTDDPTGGVFDPERHQALTHEAVAGFAEGAVVAVFGKGYALGDRLLRPALVKVAKGEVDPHEDDPETLH